MRRATPINFKSNVISYIYIFDTETLYFFFVINNKGTAKINFLLNLYDKFEMVSENTHLKKCTRHTAF